MADPKAWQIVEQAKTALAAIAGDAGVTYWNSFNAANARVVTFHEPTEPCFDTSLDLVCVLSPGEETTLPLTFGELQGELPVDIMAGVKVDETGPYQQPDPTRWELQRRLVHDIEKKLATTFPPKGTTLASLVHQMEITDVDTTGEGVYTPGWALAYVRAVFRYSYEDAAP